MSVPSPLSSDEQHVGQGRHSLEHAQIIPALVTRSPMSQFSSQGMQITR